MTEQNLKKMAHLLRNGATMLDKYCPRCNNILFRQKNGIIFCTSCNQEVKIVQASSSNQLELETVEASNINQNSEHFFFTFTEMTNTLSLLNSKLLNGVNDLAELDQIEKRLNLVSLILDIIKKIKEIQKS